MHEPDARELQPDKVLQDLFDQGRSETDQAKRKPIYEKIIRKGFLEDAPLIKMQSIEIQWASTKAVHLPILPQGAGNWVNLKVG